MDRLEYICLGVGALAGGEEEVYTSLVRRRNCCYGYEGVKRSCVGYSAMEYYKGNQLLVLKVAAWKFGVVGDICTCAIHRLSNSARFSPDFPSWNNFICHSFVKIMYFVGAMDAIDLFSTLFQAVGIYTYL